MFLSFLVRVLHTNAKLILRNEITRNLHKQSMDKLEQQAQNEKFSLHFGIWFSFNSFLNIDMYQFRNKSHSTILVWHLEMIFILFTIFFLVATIT